MQDLTLRQPRRKRVAPNLYERSDGRFECGYVDSTTGKWRMVTLRQAENLTQAKAAAREILGKRDKGVLLAPNKVTFAQVWKEYSALNESLVISGKLSERTVALYAQRYRSHLEGPLSRVLIQDVSARHLSEVLVEMRRKGLSNWTIRSVLTLAGSILGHAVGRYRADNPVNGLSKREKPESRNATEARVLDADEVKRLLDHAQPGIRPVLATACFTGLRAQELLGLRWGDVQLDRESSVIHLRHQLTRPTRTKPATLVALKTDSSSRDIEIPQMLSTLLKQHKLQSRYSSDSDFLFVNETGSPIQYRTLARGLDAAAYRAGLNPRDKQKLSPHDLRHTAITHLIRAGADVGQVARFAGHAKPSMTLDKYLGEFEARKGNDMASRMELAYAGVL